MSPIRFLKKLILNIYAEFVILNYFLVSKLNKNKLFYNSSLGFGDSFHFYLKNYLLIAKNKKNFVLSFGKINSISANFFFDKVKVISFVFKIPERFHYDIIKKIQNTKTFKQGFTSDYRDTYTEEFKKNVLFKNKDSYKRLLSKLAKKKADVKFTFKNYICINIKHYDEKIDNISGSHTRQTPDLNKVYKVINYLSSRNINCVILGNKFDKFIIKIKKKINTFQNKEKIFFFQDSDNYENLANQIMLAKNSKGYIGSDGGIMSIFYYLQKKIIVFDSYFTPSIGIEDKDIIYIYKKISFDRDSDIKILSDQTIEQITKEKKNYKITTVNFDELKLAINNLFF